jgi:hypothetical protein
MEAAAIRLSARGAERAKERMEIMIDDAKEAVFLCRLDDGN